MPEASPGTDQPRPTGRGWEGTGLGQGLASASTLYILVDRELIVQRRLVSDSSPINDTLGQIKGYPWLMFWTELETRRSRVETRSITLTD